MKTPKIESRAGAAKAVPRGLAEQLGVLRERVYGGATPEGLTLAPMDPAPCSRACPVGINVKRYVGLVAESRFEEALAVVRRDNPLAAVCGFLCNRPCELECALRAQEEGTPIPIRALKQMAARVVADSGAPPVLPRMTGNLEKGGRVAVVGGGPSGLTAARDLRLLGHAVTIFEARDQLGGMLAHEVPEHRLPRWAVSADVEYVLAHGIEARLGAAVTDGPAVAALLESGFDAVLLAVGANRDLGCGLPGEAGSEAVRSALDLLRELAAGEEPRFREAVVIGGNATAFAAATAMATLGMVQWSGRVTLLFHRERRALPVDPVTLAAAEDAGVTVRCLVRADEIEGADGLVTGVVGTSLQRTGDRLAGRSRLADAQSVLVEADFVVTAGDREPNLEGLVQSGGLSRSPMGTLAVDPVTLETDVARVFGTGEAVAGPRSVIEAVALGRRAAVAVHEALSRRSAANPVGTEGPEAPLRLGPVVGDQRSAWEHETSDGDRGDTTPFGPLGQAAHTRAGALEPEALEAARRCLRCGPCRDCATCSAYCPEGHLVEPSGAWLRAPRTVATSEIGNAVRTQARVDAPRCRACGLCEEHCPYSAPRIMARANGRLLSTVDPQSCRGCGVCVGLCPTGAMSMGHFDNAQLADCVDRLLLPHEVEQ